MQERARQQQGQGQPPRQQQGGLGLGVELPPRGKGGERRREAEAEGLRANGVTETQARAHDSSRARSCTRLPPLQAASSAACILRQRVQSTPGPAVAL